MTSEVGLWNVANILTMVRIVLVPVFVGETRSVETVAGASGSATSPMRVSSSWLAIRPGALYAISTRG